MPLIVRLVSDEGELNSASLAKVTTELCMKSWIRRLHGTTCNDLEQGKNPGFKVTLPFLKKRLNFWPVMRLLRFYYELLLL